jgi:hypothetical protein
MSRNHHSCCTHQRRWHQPEFSIETNVTASSKQRNSPRRCANNALSLVLSFDRPVLKVDELGDVSNQRQDFADTIVHKSHCGKKIDN